MSIRILNLYAGIGGNRKLWSGDIKITAVEIDPTIANTYKKLFPNDEVIIADAHEYLMKHYNEFDFIWPSPPCPSHSDFRRLWVDAGKIKPTYPDMKLYEEIIFLMQYCSCMWVIENVISYFKPLIKPFEINNHYFWSNFKISEIKTKSRCMRQDKYLLAKKNGFDINKINIKNQRKVLRNCVEPETGKHIFECAFNEKQTRLVYDD